MLTSGIPLAKQKGKLLYGPKIDVQYGARLGASFLWRQIRLILRGLTKI